ncbi:glycosyltransferase [Salinibacillus xinjiangensis]|uniref:Glycosyltransferase n=1 Tax=Salinibacillus xinjiangensis TaxID=1229268 RepID=A0A6G1X265_9BACI|nr:glycosyltransferase [Salinibacillus xinjiangensis]MRG85081.1 glycosyltransferase [Salinibacillus xinjiangensis]
MDQTRLNVLIYGDVNANIIDGSSIWLSSISETLAQFEDTKVNILLKFPVVRKAVLNNLFDYNNVEMVDPFSQGLAKKKNKSYLSATLAAEIIDELDQENHYDLVIIRGYNIAKEISQVYKISHKTIFYLTDFPQEREKVTKEDMIYLSTLYNNSAALGCQTPRLIEYFQSLLNIEQNDKFLYVPPMIPNQERNIKEFNNNNNTLIYAGKFSPLWRVPDMFRVVDSMDEENLKFVVIGDKFHNYPFQYNYKYNVERILNESEKILWKKGLTRKEVQTEIQQSDLGVSWRHEALDESMELSTKVLEFGINGKPVILNRNKLHESIYGPDYPLYANSKREFEEKIKLAFTNPEVYRHAAKVVYNVSQNHTFKKVAEHLRPRLMEIANNTKEFKVINERLFDKIRLLFAGHDLKFAQMIIDYFSAHNDYIVKIDQWDGHNTHDESLSEELLNWADVIVAEWGLGNAVWYSNRISENQKMIIRMHLQEKNTEYPKETKWNSVNNIVFIAQGIKNDIYETFPFIPEEKAKIIHNLVDTEKLDKPKLPDSNFNIGMQGICPSRKRLDLSLEIFEKLWEQDKRYNLIVKGKLPIEYKWLWARTAEREYYTELFTRINSSPWKDSVIFEGWGDISEWYQKIGFVLSPSDFESFHLAVAEGMAARTIPVIRDWDGAEFIYEDKYIYHDTEEAVDFIKQFNSFSEETQNEWRENARNFILNHYEKYMLCEKWDHLIKEVYNKQ